MFAFRLEINKHVLLLRKKTRRLNDGIIKSNIPCYPTKINGSPENSVFMPSVYILLQKRFFLMLFIPPTCLEGDRKQGSDEEVSVNAWLGWGGVINRREDWTQNCVLWRTHHENWSKRKRSKGWTLPLSGEVVDGLETHVIGWEKFASLIERNETENPATNVELMMLMSMNNKIVLLPKVLLLLKMRNKVSA